MHMYCTSISMRVSQAATQILLCIYTSPVLDCSKLNMKIREAYVCVCGHGKNERTVELRIDSASDEQIDGTSKRSIGRSRTYICIYRWPVLLLVAVNLGAIPPELQGLFLTDLDWLFARSSCSDLTTPTKVHSNLCGLQIKEEEETYIQKDQAMAGCVQERRRCMMYVCGEGNVEPQDFQ